MNQFNGIKYYLYFKISICNFPFSFIYLKYVPHGLMFQKIRERQFANEKSPKCFLYKSTKSQPTSQSSVLLAAVMTAVFLLLLIVALPGISSVLLLVLL
jgi:hypothetical protein